METAERIARPLGLEVQVEPLLIEINAGLFQGYLRSELAQFYPEEMARWRSGDPDYPMPGGESRRDLMRRGLAAFKTLAARGHEQVVVVSHGGLLAAAFKALLDIPAERNPFLLDNASISRLGITDGQVWLHSLNEVEHLREFGPSGTGEL
jgi:probable phosphoglycerate mutase